jgi:argininosuccinate lyase
MATGASRVAQDFYVWCTPEFNLVRFPDSVAGTSSIMPQKKNHVALEYLKGKAGQISGALMAAITTVKGTNFTHTGDGNRESMRNLWDAAEEALRIAGMLDLVLRSAQPNESRMLQRATDDFSSATDLADTLVRVCGLSFREAHHVVGAVVRAALNDGLNASQVTSAMVDQAARDQLGKPLLLAQSVVQASLDPRVSVQARSVIGGPNAEGVRARCAAMIAEAASQRAANLERKHGFAAARTELKRRISALAGPAQVCAVE